MYIDNFVRALRTFDVFGMDGFDAVLDDLAREGENSGFAKEFTKKIGNGKTETTTSVSCTKDGKCCTNTCHDLLDDVKSVAFDKPYTIVKFADGSKVKARCCEGDTFSKELGLLYALLIRHYANDVDGKGYFLSEGIGTKVAKLLDEAVDQQEIDLNRAQRRAVKKANRNVAKEPNNPNK